MQKQLGQIYQVLMIQLRLEKDIKKIEFYDNSYLEITEGIVSKRSEAI